MNPFLLPLAQDPIIGSAPAFGDQYRGYGWFGIFVTFMMVGFILFNIRRAEKGKTLYIRRIAGLNAIDEAVGRATEMGRPVMMVPGLSTNVNAIAVQAINIFAHVSRIAARFSSPIMLCCYSAAVYTLAQETIRDVYSSEGLSDKYDPDSVRFVSDRQFAFAAGVSGLILRERAAAAFFLGEFYAESLIFAETANSIGAIQVASSTEPTQTPFFIAACDYVLIGDEFYAASAYLTRQPVLVGSLVGQDWAKMAIMASVLFGSLFNWLYIARPVSSENKGGGEIVEYTSPQKPAVSSSFFNRLLAGDTPGDVKVERPLTEEAKKAAEEEKAAAEAAPTAPTGEGSAYDATATNVPPDTQSDSATNVGNESETDPAQNPTMTGDPGLSGNEATNSAEDANTTENGANNGAPNGAENAGGGQ